VGEDMKQLSAIIEQADSTSSGLELVHAVDAIANISKEVSELEDLMAKKMLKPLYYQTLESCQTEVVSISKELNNHLAQLASAIAQGNVKFQAVVVRDTANALMGWTNAVKGLAACTNDNPSFQEKLIVNAKQLAMKTQKMIEAIKTVPQSEFNLLREGKNDLAKQPKRAKEVNDFVEAANLVLANVIKILPGNKDIEKTINVVVGAIDKLKLGQVEVVNSEESYGVIQERLNVAAASLAQACNSLVSASRQSTLAEMKTCTSNFETTFTKLLNVAQTMSVSTSDKDTKEKVANYVQKIAEISNKLLQDTKRVYIDPSGVGSRNQLNASAREMAEAIGILLQTATTMAPGQHECSEADHTLTMANALLDDVNLTPLSKDETYVKSLEDLGDLGKKFIQNANEINSFAKTNDSQKVADAILRTSQTAFEITRRGAVAAYIIGTNHPNSIPRVEGIINSSLLSKCAEEVKESCSKLLSAKISQQDILQAAAVIARNTSALCSMCKTASNNDDISVNSKQQFLASAKSMATATSQIVSVIKKLASSISSENIEECKNASSPLLRSINDLIMFSSSAEFAGKPGQISPLAYAEQKPIIQSNKNLIAISQDIVSCGRNICSGKVDAISMQLLATQIKSLTESFRNFSNIVKSNTPGQKECQDAINVLGNLVTDIDTAIIQIDVPDGVASASDTEGDLHAMETSLSNNIRAFSSLRQIICDAAVSRLKNNGKVTASQFSESVMQFSTNFRPAITTAISYAKSCPQKSKAIKLLEGMKEIAELSNSFLYTCKLATSDPSQVDMINLDKDNFKGVSEKVLYVLEGCNEGTGEIKATIENMLPVTHTSQPPLKYIKMEKS
jgi:talin